MTPTGRMKLPIAMVELCTAEIGHSNPSISYVWLDTLDGMDRAKLIATNGSVLIAAPVEISGAVAAGPIHDLPLTQARARDGWLSYFEGSNTWSAEGCQPRGIANADQLRFPAWRHIVPKDAFKAKPDIMLNGIELDVLQRALNGGEDSAGGLRIACTRNEGGIDANKVTFITPDWRCEHKAFALMMPMRFGE